MGRYTETGDYIWERRLREARKGRKSSERVIRVKDEMVGKGRNIGKDVYTREEKA